MDWNFVRKILSFFLAWLMLTPSGPPSGFAQTDVAKDARRAQAVKSAVLQLGAGKDTRVMVSLESRRTKTGYVNDVQEDGFIVRNLCTDEVTTVPYGHVRGLRGLNVANGMRVSVSKMPKGTPKLTVGSPCGTSAQARYVDHEVRNAVIAGVVIFGAIVGLAALLGAATR
jgi:hypothetical protein